MEPNADQGVPHDQSEDLKLPPTNQNLAGQPSEGNANLTKAVKAKKQARINGHAQTNKNGAAPEEETKQQLPPILEPYQEHKQDQADPNNLPDANQPSPEQVESVQKGEEQVEEKSQISPNDVVRQKPPTSRGRKPRILNADDPYSRAKTFMTDQSLTLQQMKDHPDWRDLLSSDQALWQRLRKCQNNRSQYEKKSRHSDSLTRISAADSSQLDTSSKQNYYLQAQTVDINHGVRVAAVIARDEAKKFQELSSQEKKLFLKQHCERDAQQLLEVLLSLHSTKASLPELFGWLNEAELTENLTEVEQGRLFVHSLLFYDKAEKYPVQRELFMRALKILASTSNMHMIQAMACYVFINEPVWFTQDATIIDSLDNSYKLCISHMKNFFHQEQLIDSAVCEILPQTLRILNPSFIQLLKDDHGKSLIKGVQPENYISLINIAALSEAKSFEALKQFVDTFRQEIADKWEELNKKNIRCFLQGMEKKLQVRSPHWYTRIEQTTLLLKKLIVIQQEKTGSSRDLCHMITQCLEGNMAQLGQYQEMPRAMLTISAEQRSRILEQFERNNPENEGVQQMVEMGVDDALNLTHLHQQMQEILNFDFHSIQKLCLNYTQLFDTQRQFACFGIGNGKTLLCTAIAITKALNWEKSVFIVSKNKHLSQRDQKKFEKLVAHFGLSSYLENYTKDIGIFYYSQTAIDSILKEEPGKSRTAEQFKSKWSKSIVIVDEYDWIFFDQGIDYMISMFNLYSSSLQTIGFTGSILMQKELECLKRVFNTQPVTYPSLISIDHDKRIHLQDEIIVEQDDKTYCSRIIELAKEQQKISPTVIVGIGQTLLMLQEAFKGMEGVHTFVKAGGKQVAQGLNTSNFTSKNSRQKYGIYIINESLGRGTDLQTNELIERNGGNYLILANVFSKRSEEQVIGRIGRLGGKGKWHYVLRAGKGEENSTVEQVVRQKQEADLQQTTAKLSELLAKLSNIYSSTPEENADMKDAATKEDCDMDELSSGDEDFAQGATSKRLTADALKTLPRSTRRQAPEQAPPADKPKPRGAKRETKASDASNQGQDSAMIHDDESKGVLIEDTGNAALSGNQDPNQPIEQTENDQDQNKPNEPPQQETEQKPKKEIKKAKKGKKGKKQDGGKGNAKSKTDTLLGKSKQKSPSELESEVLQDKCQEEESKKPSVASNRKDNTDPPGKEIAQSAAPSLRRSKRTQGTKEPEIQTEIGVGLSQTKTLKPNKTPSSDLPQANPVAQLQQAPKINETRQDVMLSPKRKSERLLHAILQPRTPIVENTKELDAEERKKLVKKLEKKYTNKDMLRI